MRGGGGAGGGGKKRTRNGQVVFVVCGRGERGNPCPKKKKKKKNCQKTHPTSTRIHQREKKRRGSGVASRGHVGGGGKKKGTFDALYFMSLPRGKKGGGRVESVVEKGGKIYFGLRERRSPKLHLPCPEKITFLLSPWVQEKKRRKLKKSNGGGERKKLNEAHQQTKRDRLQNSKRGWSLSRSRGRERELNG